jgi:hypothetical protein
MAKDRNPSRRPGRLPDELRGEQSNLEALRAHELRGDYGRETPGETMPPADGVLVQVCLECGKEYTFETKPPPSKLTCEKCGNTVFRSFFEVTGSDDVETDFQDSTARDLSTEDDPEDVTRSDILDLDNL